MKNKPTTYWSPPIVNKSKSGGVIFPPSVSYADVTNPAIPVCGRLLAHPCAGSRLFLFLSIGGICHSERSEESRVHSRYVRRKIVNV